MLSFADVLSRVTSGTRHRVGLRILTVLVLATGMAALAPVRVETSAIEPSKSEKPAPTPWRPCPVTAREEARDRVVRTFERGPGVSTTGAVMPAGSSALTCGDDNYGYYHIANRHGEQWTQKGAKTSENWRDVADYAIAEALRNPMKVTYRAANNTYCYSREVYLVNKVRGIPVDVFHPNVVVRVQDGAIVTSYPANEPCR